jgi:hypothetical protein
MSTAGCSEFQKRLEAWLEGQGSAEAQAHLHDCAECRLLVEDLDAIRQTAGAWAAQETDPPARVWVSLRAQLEQEGLIRGAVLGAVRDEVHDQEKTHPASGFAGWIEGIFASVPRPAMAGAYLLALIAVSFAVTGPSQKQANENRWISGTQTSTGPLSAKLQAAEQDSISSMVESNPIVKASLHDNLAIVDNYIALCEKSVQEDPESEGARDYLYDAYEQKADLLAQITERGADGR